MQRNQSFVLLKIHRQFSLWHSHILFLHHSSCRICLSQCSPDYALDACWLILSQHSLVIARRWDKVIYIFEKLFCRNFCRNFSWILSEFVIWAYLLKLTEALELERICLTDCYLWCRREKFLRIPSTAPTASSTYSPKYWNKSTFLYF